MVAARPTRAREGANFVLNYNCDFHTGFQQVAIFDNRTGEYQEKRLQHRQEPEPFYRALAKAVARKLATRLYLMLRADWTYAQLCRAVVHASPSQVLPKTS
jgi:hypothetical protein